MILTQCSLIKLSKFSVFCLLSGTIFLTHTPIVRAIPRLVNPEFAQVSSLAPAPLIDRYTDHFFYQVNPELQGRKLTTRDQEYIREWNNLRAVIAPMIRPTREVCYRAEQEPADLWDFNFQGMPDSYSNPYDYLADVIFYSRHPELLRQKLRPGTSEAQEWSAIREKLFVSTCGL